MVSTCCVYGCCEKSVAGGGGPITFHTFPKDEKRRKQWSINLKRDNFKITDYTKICSKHFTTESFDREKFGCTWLKKDAIPTLFDSPSDLCTKQLKQEETSLHIQEIFSLPSDLCIKEIKQEETSQEDSQEISSPPLDLCIKEIKQEETSQEGIQEISSPPAETSKKRKYYLGDFSEDDMDSPTKARQVLEIAKDQYKKSRLKIKQSNRKKKRLEKRIHSLKEILRLTKKKLLISQSTNNTLKPSLPDPASELIK